MAIFATFWICFFEAPLGVPLLSVLVGDSAPTIGPISSALDKIPPSLDLRDAPPLDVMLPEMFSEAFVASLASCS